MGFFDKIFGSKETVDVPDLEDLMSAEGDVVSPPADFYVKRIDLRNEGDGDLAVKELSTKNIIIVNVTPLAKQPNRLKTILSKLKVHTGKINGDIALLYPRYAHPDSGQRQDSQIETEAESRNSHFLIFLFYILF